jgi:hypothetical protein
MTQTLQQLIEAAYDQSEALAEWLGPLRQEAYDRWLRESGEAADFLARVMRLSPNKPMSQILAQPDVQAALRVPFLDAATFTEDAIHRAWSYGSMQGYTDARRELADQEIDVADLDPIGDAMRRRLLADVRRNSTAASRRFRRALGAEDPGAELGRIVREYAMRASLGVDAAGRHSHSAAKEQVYRAAARLFKGVIRKVWVTSFSSTTCAMCAALHGTRRDLGEAFPEDRSFGRALTVYGGRLNHPPRHPNCRCRIVLYLSAFDNERSTAESMREFGRRWWSRIRNQES